MTDAHQLLTELSKQARSEIDPNVDVQQRVIASLSIHAAKSYRDMEPLAVCSVAVAVAATTIFAFLPSWQTMSEPWASYFPL